MNYQTLTLSEVLHFRGWWPFHMRDEFDQYRVDPLDLESFPPTDYGFGISKHIVEAELSNLGGVLQGPRLM